MVILLINRIRLYLWCSCWLTSLSVCLYCMYIYSFYIFFYLFVTAFGVNIWANWGFVFFFHSIDHHFNRIFQNLKIHTGISVVLLYCVFPFITNENNIWWELYIFVCLFLIIQNPNSLQNNSMNRTYQFMVKFWIFGNLRFHDYIMMICWEKVMN